MNENITIFATRYSKTAHILIRFNALFFVQTKYAAQTLRKRKATKKWRHFNLIRLCKRQMKKDDAIKIAQSALLICSINLINFQIRKRTNTSIKINVSLMLKMGAEIIPNEFQL